MRAGLIITAWLSLAVAGAAMAWATQGPPQPDAEPAAAQQAAPPPAPEPSVSQPRGAADPGLTHRDFEQLEKVTGLQIKVLETQIDSMGDRLSDSNDRLLVLIALATVAAGFTGYLSARREARDAAEKWINDEGGKVLGSLKEEAEKKIKGIIDQSKRDFKELVEHANRQKERLDHILERVNLQVAEPGKPEITPIEMEEVNLAAREAKSKPTGEKTSQDWIAQGLSAYFAENYEDAAIAFENASRSSDVSTLNMAKALVTKGAALGKAGKPDDVIAAFDEVARRFGDSDETALLEWVAHALNGKAFVRLTLAKKARKSGENAEEVKALLSQALNDAEAALEITPDKPMFLGNKGYALFLLARKEDAEPLLRRALELGGKEQRDLELEDAAIHPLPEDEAFKELISRLWLEVSAKGDNDST